MLFSLLCVTIMPMFERSGFGALGCQWRSKRFGEDVAYCTLEPYVKEI